MFCRATEVKNWKMEIGHKWNLQHLYIPLSVTLRSILHAFIRSAGAPAFAGCYTESSWSFRNQSKFIQKVDFASAISSKVKQWYHTAVQ